MRACLHAGGGVRKAAGLFAAPQRAGYRAAMPDSVALPALALVAAGLIALALVWPQGEGARSPAPFGHPLSPIESPLAKVVAPLALRGPEAIASLAGAKPTRPPRAPKR
jgi:hypothetical protein